MSRNCFVSYHHGKDHVYMEELRKQLTELELADYSLKENISHLKEEAIYRRIREKMRNCSVTIVLVGAKTGHRKWIDWELWASLRSYTHKDTHKSFKPSGLLAIYLPTLFHSEPERLVDNLHSGYAVRMDWSEVNKDLEKKIEEAFQNRDNKSNLINNSRKRQEKDYANFLGLKI